MAFGSKVKGITIEFAGDTTKLGKALKDIDAQTRTVDDQLKSVNTALKFNPKNTELLAQKQQLLGQKVQQTKDKLTALRDAQAKLDDDPAVDKTSQEYMELRREIITTESKLKHFEEQLKEMDRIKFQQLGQQFKDVGGKMQSVGQGMTKYVTGPILAAGAASTAAFNEVNEGLIIVTQKTGATGEALADMHDIVKDIAKDVPADFNSIGSAVGEVNTRFGLQGQELQDLSAEYVKFAKLNETDVSNAVDSTQKALSAFNLDASHAGDLLDILTRVSQNTGISVDALSNGLVQNGAAFQELGLDIQQSAVLMGDLEKSGANADTVMQGLRRALKNAAADGIPLDDALSNLQDTIENGTGSMDGLTAAYDLFGKSGDQIYGAVKNGTLNFNDLAGAAENMSGVLDRTFEETLTPAEKFQTTVNALKVTGYEIANTILPLLMPVMEKVANKAQELAEAWNNLTPEQQKLIIAIAGIVAGLGPLLVILGKVATGIGALIQIAPVLGTAFSALAGPVGIVIGIIGALIAVGVLLYKNWDKIKAAAKALKDALVARFTEAKNSVKAIFQALKTAMVTPIEKARDLIKGIIDKIKGFFSNLKFKWPQIKLPHFSIQPEGWKIGDLLKGSIPHLGIDWYAKGGIFNSPTVAGLGDVRGGEAAVPLDPFWNRMDKIVEAVENNSGQGVTINVYASEGMDVRQLAAEVERRLVRIQKQRERVFA